MDWKVVAIRLVQAVVVALAGGGVGQQIGIGASVPTYEAMGASQAALQGVIADLAVDLAECEGGK